MAGSDVGSNETSMDGSKHTVGSVGNSVSSRSCWGKVYSNLNSFHGKILTLISMFIFYHQFPLIFKTIKIL